MIDFWYSERCSRNIKLMIYVITIGILYYCSSIAKLNTLFSSTALLIGISIHVFRQLQLKFISVDHPRPALNLLLSRLPLLALIVILLYLPMTDRLVYSAQVIGFTALGFFLVSHYSQRARRDG